MTSSRVEERSDFWAWRRSGDKLVVIRLYSMYICTSTDGSRFDDAKLAKTRVHKAWILQGPPPLGLLTDARTADESFRNELTIATIIMIHKTNILAKKKKKNSSGHT